MSDLKDFDDPNGISRTFEVKMEDYTGPMIYESPDGGKTVRSRPLVEPTPVPDYKFNEGDLINEFKEYIDSTYSGHYSKNNFQATEFIIDGGHGEGFCIGNIMKYAQRIRKKDGKNRRDLLKVIHYGIIALHVNEMENLDNETK